MTLHHIAIQHSTTYTTQCSLAQHNTAHRNIQNIHRIENVRTPPQAYVHQHAHVHTHVHVHIHRHVHKNVFPTCQMKVVRFYVRCAAPPASCHLSFPSSSPDLHCQLSIAVGLAGPPLPALDRSGPRRTSSASS